MVFEIEEFQFDDNATKHNVKEIIAGKLYTQIEEFRPEKGDAVVDAGAQMGYYSVLCAKRYSAGRVFAFEPLADNFKILLENRGRNGAYQIVPFNHTLGAKNGTVEWFISDSVINNLGIGERRQAETRILDQVTLPEINILKITAPGYVMKVLRGAAGKIKNDHPKLILQADSREESFSIFRFLKPFSYELEEEVESINVGEEQEKYHKILFYD
jgi:FkbM family methyltransferase